MVVKEEINTIFINLGAQSSVMQNKKLFKDIACELKKQGAKSVSILGSYAKNTNKAGSDIDVMVQFKSKKSLLDLIRIERELSEKIKIHVDLLTKDSISPYIKEAVDKEKLVVL